MKIIYVDGVVETFEEDVYYDIQSNVTFITNKKHRTIKVIYNHAVKSIEL